MICDGSSRNPSEKSPIFDGADSSQSDDGVDRLSGAIASITITRHCCADIVAPKLSGSIASVAITRHCCSDTVAPKLSGSIASVAIRSHDTVAQLRCIITSIVIASIAMRYRINRMEPLQSHDNIQRMSPIAITWSLRINRDSPDAIASPAIQTGAISLVVNE